MLNAFYNLKSIKFFFNLFNLFVQLIFRCNQVKFFSKRVLYLFKFLQLVRFESVTDSFSLLLYINLLIRKKIVLIRIFVFINLL